MHAHEDLLRRAAGAHGADVQVLEQGYAGTLFRLLYQGCAAVGLLPSPFAPEVRTRGIHAVLHDEITEVLSLAKQKAGHEHRRANR